MFPVAALVVVLAQQVVTPTWVPHELPVVQDRVCTANVPCEQPAPQAKTVCEAPCVVPCAEPQCSVVHSEMRSKPFFWTGLGLVGGGTALIIGATTWARDSEPGFVGAPCGTDPLLVRGPIAPCRVSRALLTTGAAMAGGGAALMIYGGQRVWVNADGHRVTITVRF